MSDKNFLEETTEKIVETCLGHVGFVSADVDREDLKEKIREELQRFAFAVAVDSRKCEQVLG